MGQVVRHDLIGVDRSGGGDVRQPLVDDVAREIDGGRGGVEVGDGEVGGAHGARK